MVFSAPVFMQFRVMNKLF